MILDLHYACLAIHHKITFVVDLRAEKTRRTHSDIGSSLPLVSVFSDLAIQCIIPRSTLQKLLLNIISYLKPVLLSRSNPRHQKCQSICFLSLSYSDQHSISRVFKSFQTYCAATDGKELVDVTPCRSVGIAIRMCEVASFISAQSSAFFLAACTCSVHLCFQE